MKAKNYLPIIVVLRGLAALAVCMFHFTKEFVDEEGVIRAIFRNGWMGVEVFFVISGFVIPFSLLGTSFGFRHYGKFLKKRFLRIEPAYLVSVIVVIGLNYLASSVPGFAGEPYQVSMSLLLQHVGYLVGLFGNTWLNPVYWTLEIEFHYYLVIGVLIALWNLNKKWLIILSIFGFFALSLIKENIIPLFSYTDIFVLGILTAFYKKEKLSSLPYLTVLGLVSLAIYHNHGPIISFLTLITALLIAYLSNYGKYKVLLFLGNISYSLYLLHVPIGGKIINLSKRLELSETSKFGIIMIALTFSILAAWLFYLFIEKPSHNWAKRVKFK